ncbi:MAG: aminoacyl-tRNA hydrolase [Spirochaetia bacterium]|nr:aminoacyl-tRNA hydrolase [Spirochaetia bacterium]
MVPESIAIAGLGNPGAKYRNNRHNAGFLLLDYLESAWQTSSRDKKSGAEFSKASHPDFDSSFLFIWPQKFMNLSGQPVCDLMKFFKIPVEHLIVLHDEIELPFSEIRSKKGGGHKGHNGLRDIMLHCKSPDFYRIRFGVGRPDHPDVASHVLSDFNLEEQSSLGLCYAKSEKEIFTLLKKLSEQN